MESSHIAFASLKLGGEQLLQSIQEKMQDLACGIDKMSYQI